MICPLWLTSSLVIVSRKWAWTFVISMISRVSSEKLLVYMCMYCMVLLNLHMVQHAQTVPTVQTVQTVQNNNSPQMWKLTHPNAGLMAMLNCQTSLSDSWKYPQTVHFSWQCGLGLTSCSTYAQFERLTTPGKFGNSLVLIEVPAVK